MIAERLTTADLCTRFRCSSKTLQRWINAGTIPPDAYFRVGRRYLFYPDKIAALEAKLT